MDACCCLHTAGSWRPLTCRLTLWDRPSLTPPLEQRTRSLPDFAQQQRSFVSWLMRRADSIRRLALTAERWEDDSAAVLLRLAVAELVAARLHRLRLVCEQRLDRGWAEQGGAGKGREGGESAWPLIDCCSHTCSAALPPPPPPQARTAGEPPAHSCRAASVFASCTSTFGAGDYACAVDGSRARLCKDVARLLLSPCCGLPCSAGLLTSAPAWRNLTPLCCPAGPTACPAPWPTAPR